METHNRDSAKTPHPQPSMSFGTKYIWKTTERKIPLKTISFSLFRAQVFIFLDDKNLHSAPKRKIRPGAEYMIKRSQKDGKAMQP